MERFASVRTSARLRPAPLIAILLGCVALLVAGPLFPSGKEAGPLSFGVMGDLPYTAAEISLFPRFIQDMNQDRDLEFVVHLGDFKDGASSRCSDQMFLRAKAWFDLSEHPLIYTPGDNEWTDCHRAGLGRYDPLERLARLRQIFFPDRRSLGQRSIPLARQSGEAAYAEFPENARWTIEEVVFATLHVVGSNNNRGRTAEGDAEHARQTAATIAWTRDAFALARAQGRRAVVLILHANPFFERRPEQRTGFNAFLSELESEAREFKKPVLLIHGDTHRFRVDRPLRGTRDRLPAQNLTRLETFGSPRMDWVKVTIDPGVSPRFRIVPGRFGTNSDPGPGPP